MEWKLYQNVILTGSLDYFCLVCEFHFRTEEDACNHIEKPIHKKNLSALLYVEKFEEDNIRKVKLGYFCEFCNILLPTLPKVELHIQEEKHRNTKGTMRLQRNGNSVIAYGRVNINDKAWNGFIENMCVLCSSEFNNENIHKSSATHLINLIKNNVEFTVENYLYRKIDETSFQCLTCNKELAISLMQEHFKDKTHKDSYKKCSAPIVKPEVTKPLEEINNVITKTFPKNDSTRFEKIKKDEVNRAGSPSNKQETINQKDKKQRLAMDKRICSALGASNYIVQEKGELICILCQVSIEGQKRINEHVSSKHHKTILKLHEEQFNTSDEKPPQKDANAAEKDQSKIVDNVSIYQNNDINIHFERRTAYCKKCKKHLSFDFKAIENHIGDHNKLPKKDETKPQVDLHHRNTSSSSGTGAEKKNTLFTKPVHIKKEPNSPVGDSKKVSEKDVPQATSSQVSLYKPNSNEKPADKPYSEAEMVALGKKNEMSYHRGEHRMFCHVCNVSVPANMKNIEQHIKGNNHVFKMKAVNKGQPNKETKVNLHKVLLGDFVDTITSVQNLFLKDVVINERFCISANSFAFIFQSEALYLRCFLCRTNLTMDTVDSHCRIPAHVRAMAAVSVVISLFDEFVREIRPDEFHCGYCNVLQIGYFNLESHLKTVAHHESKNAANNRLQHYEEFEQNNRRHLEFMMLFS